MRDRKDFMLLWNWEYDIWFISIIKEKCREKKIKAFFVNEENLRSTLDDLRKKKYRVKVLLDRASDSDEDFEPLVEELLFSGTKLINDTSLALRAMDKATMHLEFLTKGIDVPHTVIVGPETDWNLISGQIEHLTRPFVVKPAIGGGGEGILLDAYTVEDIKRIIEGHNAGEKYLVQERVIPTVFSGKKGYFRVYYVCGEIIPCWWDNETHVFGDIVSREEREKYGLDKLFHITQLVAEVSGVDFFSTEICVTKEERFVVVDYVNDPCDLRPKSVAYDGIPDGILLKIVNRLVQFIKDTEWQELTEQDIELLRHRRKYELALLREKGLWGSQEF